MKVIRQFVDGDYVISEFVMEGTREWEWIGIKPTHKRLWKLVALWCIMQRENCYRRSGLYYVTY